MTVAVDTNVLFDVDRGYYRTYFPRLSTLDPQASKPS